MAPESAGAARGLESIVGSLQAFAQFRYSSLRLDFGNNAEWCWDDHHATTSCRIPPMYPVRNKSGTPAAEYGLVELPALLEVLDSKQKEWQDAFRGWRARASPPTGKISLHGFTRDVDGQDLMEKLRQPLLFWLTLRMDWARFITHGQEHLCWRRPPFFTRIYLV